MENVGVVGNRNVEKIRKVGAERGAKDPWSRIIESTGIRRGTIGITQAVYSQNGSGVKTGYAKPNGDRNTAVLIMVAKRMDGSDVTMKVSKGPDGKYGKVDTREDEAYVKKNGDRYYEVEKSEATHVVRRSVVGNSRIDIGFCSVSWISPIPGRGDNGQQAIAKNPVKKAVEVSPVVHRMNMEIPEVALW